MAKKKVIPIITKYKNQKAKINFYTDEGERVPPETVKRVSKKEKVEFFSPSPSPAAT